MITKLTTQKEEDNRLKCYYFGSHCLNNAVAECDFADGKGVRFYCRHCIEDFSDPYGDGDVDESLVFCQREWDTQ